jgi:hypothetical protein
MPRSPKNPSIRQSLAKKPVWQSSPVNSDDEDDECARLDSGEEPQLTHARLLEKALLITEQWYKSKNTQKGYALYVREGKKFVEEWDTEHAEAADVEMKDGTVESTLDSPQLDQASSSSNDLILSHIFDKIGEHTPTALQLYTADKCKQQKQTFSVAEGIHSAFKLYFKR